MCSVGDTINEWIVIDLDNTWTGNTKHWRFQCKNCGAVKIMTERAAHNGHCSCYRRHSRKIRSVDNKLTCTVDINNTNVLIAYQDEQLYLCKLDRDDYTLVSSFNWRNDPKGYVVCMIDGKIISMHRYIYFNGDIEKMKRTDLVVDHINGDTTDNRRCNLRLVTMQQNLLNRKTSRKNKVGLAGVTYNKKNDKYYVKIRKSGKTYNLGSYKTFEEAKNARIQGEIKYYGEFSRHSQNNS